MLLFNADDAECITTFAPFKGKTITFGIQSEADFTAQKITFDKGITAFDFCQSGRSLCRISLTSMGMHNVYNALAAASAAFLCGASPVTIQSALASFEGAARRMQYKGTLPSGAVLYDDYAHHPDEIKATLAGARRMGFSRILCAYQPHTYSRTAGLFDEFSHAFADADTVFFTDIYAAREQNTFGISSADLARATPGSAYCPSFPALAEALRQHAHDGDLVIVMGAGDVNRVFELLI
jgi:UDP-N-acetylmuramate--alanine ligase